MNRVKLAYLLLAPALVLVLAGVVVTLVSLSALPAETADATRAGLARVGDDLALVIVSEGNAIGGVREIIARWGLAVPAVILGASAIAAWLVSGRVSRTVDDARVEVLRADDERASRLQDIVHELRTPLAVMGTNLELAARETLDDPGAQRYVGAARQAVGRMSRTVDDLAGHGRLTVEQGGVPVDLAAVAREVVSEHAGPARNGGVRVWCRRSGRLLVPYVDPAAVQAALGNFMSNAVRLAPIGSTVTVDWGEHESWAWIAIIDEGPGLAPHHHARAFERGWQGAHDRDRAATHGGAGLGLTIARQLTEAQGGVVTVDSEEGWGAAFTVWLPLEHGAEKSAVVAPDQLHPVLKPWEKVLTGS